MRDGRTSGRGSERGGPLLRPLAALGVAWLAACGGAPTPGPWQTGDGYRWRALPPAGLSSPGFTELGGRAGIRFRNTVSDSAASRNRHLMHGSGVAIADVDGDDLPDVYLARIEGPNALFKNLGGWRFRDVAEDAGVTLADRASTGATFADVDGDGDQDLLVNAMGGKNALFLNDGTGHFTEAARTHGLVDEARGSTTSTLADVDGDGDLDLYVANYKARTMLDSLSPAERSFDAVVRRSGDRFEVVPALRDHYRIVRRDDVRAVSLVQRADPDWFYLNDGQGHFTRIPLAAPGRFLDPAGRPLEREPDDFGLAARFYDVDGDGAPDLYVANDFEDPDQLWINDGTGRFRLAGPDAVRQTSNSGMAVDMADVDRDGRVDLFEVDMLARDSHRRKTESPTNTAVPKVIGQYDRQAQWQRNVLLWNRGEGRFAEIAAYAGVEATGWSWSTAFLDVDLDGFEDLLIGTGHTWDLMDTDAIEALRAGRSAGGWREERRLYPRLDLANVALRNRGDLTFEDQTEGWRFGLAPDVSHGLALGDLDRDGDLDVVINRLDAPALVLRNDAPAARVAVRLRGRAPNTAGIGAVVTVRGGAVPMQSRELTAGGLYLSSSEAVLAFAAGASDSLEIEVRWRSGARSRVGAAPSRLYEIEEPETGAGPDEPAPAPDPLFEDRSSAIAWRHHDPPFNELRRQPLLPWRLTELGPGIGWADLDADGDDDLVVGAGAGSASQAFLNDRGRFRAAPTVASRDSFDLTAIVASGQSVWIGQSSYEAPTPRAALEAPGVFRYRLEGGRWRGAAEVSGDTTSVGPLALGDVDGDGALDLFVGGRVAPGVYPLASNSRLYRGGPEGWTLDSLARRALRGIGLISGAVFTDLDSDGDPDLVLATEWGPVRILRNDQGRLHDATAELGMEGWTGRWNGVTAADLDGDGRLDLVATNWGRNTGLEASAEQPLWLYFGDFGGTGVVHPLLARFDPRIGEISPFAPLPRLSAVLPAVRRAFPTNAAYADASIDRVLAGMGRARGRLGAATLDQMVFLNRGDRFEARPLPMEAQIAPAFGVAAADFDGDGSIDLFLAQNFSGTDLLSPRFDAGRGLVLLNDGHGSFRPLEPAASGIVMVEDQRGVAVADFDRDGRVDLAVGRNSAPVALYRNRRGAPGVTVRSRGSMIGAIVRVEAEVGLGPAYEVHAGSGYWSQDGRLTVGLPPGARALVIRWPGGREERVPLGAGARVVDLGGR